MIFSLSALGSKYCASSLASLCDECAVWTARSVMNNTLETRFELENKSVSFKGISHWYSDGAYQTASWLELLDLHKWLFISHSGAKIDCGSYAEPVTKSILPSSEFKESIGFQLKKFGSLSGINTMDCLQLARILYSCSDGKGLVPMSSLSRLAKSLPLLYAVTI